MRRLCVSAAALLVLALPAPAAAPARWTTSAPQGLPHFQGEPYRLAALQRTLDAAGLTPERYAALSAEAQLPAIKQAVSARAAELAGLEFAPDEGSPARTLVALSERRQALRDATALLVGLFDEPERRELHSRLKARHDELEPARALAESRLLERGMELMKGGGVEWKGRTALLPLGDGHRLALKFARARESGEARKQEAHQMDWAGNFGLETPTAVSPESARKADARFPVPGGLRNQFTAFVIPDGLYERHYDYLGDRLQGRLTPSERREAVSDMALKAIEDMGRLKAAGYAHESLAPLSHSNVPWAWWYIRWKTLGLPGRPYGPTAIHNPEQGLAHANVRASGLADYEHVVEHSPRRVGQNLFDWSLLVMRAGAVNGLSDAETLELLSRGWRRHAELFAPAAAIDRAALEAGLARAARSFERARRALALIPRPLAHLWNKGLVAQQPPPKGSEPGMPGVAVWTLVMDLVWPYARVLDGKDPSFAQQHAAVLGTSSRAGTVDSVLRWTVERALEGLIALFMLGFAFLAAAMLALGAALFLGAELSGALGAWLSLGSIVVALGAPMLFTAYRVAADSIALRRRARQSPWIQLPR